VDPFNLTNVDSRPKNTSDIVAPIDQNQFLELQNVNVARGDRVVLHDVNLTLRAGEHVAILGPNGCGKSTLILTITCQIYPIVQPGMRVRIFGRDRWDLTQLRKHFGVVGTDLPGERTAVTNWPRCRDRWLLLRIDSMAQSVCNR
jgi:ABC-type molybdenum transport system ATPase subunit/photorepair protein PhrA